MSRAFNSSVTFRFSSNTHRSSPRVAETSMPTNIYGFLALIEKIIGMSYLPAGGYQ